MAGEPIKYKRLPGRVWVPINLRRAGSLWLGPDHILLVSDNGYTEGYKRFYLAEIQGFIVRRTKRRMILNMFFGFLLAVVYAISLAAGDATTALVMALLPGAFLWIPILINSLRGPTCTVHVRTAVQTEMLAPLQRIRAFEKFLAIARPLIVAEQGEIDPTLAPEGVQQSAFSPAEIKPAARPFSPRLHSWFFAVVIVLCAAGFVFITLPSPISGGSYFAAFAIACALAVGAVIRQHTDRCGDTALLSLTWLAGFLLLVNFCIHYVQMMIHQMKPANVARDPFGMGFGLISVRPADDTFMFWQMTVFLFLAWAVGMFGAIRAHQLRPAPAAEITS